MKTSKKYIWEDYSEIYIKLHAFYVLVVSTKVFHETDIISRTIVDMLVK